MTQDNTCLRPRGYSAHCLQPQQSAVTVHHISRWTISSLPILCNQSHAVLNLGPEITGENEEYAIILIQLLKMYGIKTNEVKEKIVLHNKEL